MFYKKARIHFRRRVDQKDTKHLKQLKKSKSFCFHFFVSGHRFKFDWGIRLSGNKFELCLGELEETFKVIYI
jgi:hypothetical protein